MEPATKVEEQVPFKEINQAEIENQGKFADCMFLSNTSDSQNVIPLEKDIRVEVRKILEQLELVERSYFGKDRMKQMKLKINDAIALLDQKPIDLGKYTTYT